MKIYNVRYVRDQEIRNICVRKNGKMGYAYSERTRRVHTHIKNNLLRSSLQKFPFWATVAHGKKAMRHHLDIAKK